LHYEELIPAIDILAERIRTLGSKVDGSYENFAKLTKFKSADKNLKNDAMVKDLIAANNVVIDLLKNGVLIAQKDSDDATADILIGRIEAHQKNVWMLNSSL
jgi:starvation-inducible DNA-binding protein